MRSWFLAGGMLLFLATGQAAASDSLSDIQKELNQIFRGGKVDEEKAVSVMDRCLALALENEEEAFDALSIVPQIASRVRAPKALELRDEAVDKLIEKYVDDERLAEFVFQSFMRVHADDRTKVREWVKEIIDGSTVEANKVACLFAQASMIKNSEEELSRAEREEAAKIFRNILDKHAELSSPYGATYGDMAKGELFELENLAIGATAPEIEGNDLAGVPFKLSDYRGKVVVLDFWGNW